MGTVMKSCQYRVRKVGHLEDGLTAEPGRVAKRMDTHIMKRWVGRQPVSRPEGLTVSPGTERASVQAMNKDQIGNDLIVVVGDIKVRQALGSLGLLCLVGVVALPLARSGEGSGQKQNAPSAAGRGH